MTGMGLACLRDMPRMANQKQNKTCNSCKGPLDYAYQESGSTHIYHCRWCGRFIEWTQPRKVDHA